MVWVRNIAYLIAASLIILLFFGGTSFFSNLGGNNERQVISEDYSKVTIGEKSFNTIVAEDQETRSVGLMNVESLSTDSGMIFVFPNEGKLSFWMKNTLIPLDIIFISKDKFIVDMKKAFQPCVEEPCESYTSRLPAKYALEINSGLSDEYGFQIGDQVLFGEVYQTEETAY